MASLTFVSNSVIWTTFVRITLYITAKLDNIRTEDCQSISNPRYNF